MTDSVESNMLEEHIKCKELVAEILSKDINARNNDDWLIIEVWRRQGLKVFIDYKNFQKVYKSASIRRVRAELQNTEGKFPPTNEETLRLRSKKEGVIHSYYADKKQEGLGAWL